MCLYTGDWYDDVFEFHDDIHDDDDNDNYDKQ